MKDITVIIPLHVFNEDVRKECERTFSSLRRTIETYTHGDVTVMAVVAPEVSSDISFKEFIDGCGLGVELVVNNGNTDFCSQVNMAVDMVKTEHFTIMEFDDEYTPKWFNMAYDYFVGEEGISIMLPVNLTHDPEGKNWQYGNTMALTPAFISENENDDDPVGIINKYRINGSSLFNLTGAIFNTKDFIFCGKYKPSIEVAFNYEYLLRMTSKGLKAMVAPKEGYVHTLQRKDSLGDMYMKKYSDKEITEWFLLAERECMHDEDRGVGLESLKKEELK